MKRLIPFSAFAILMCLSGITHAQDNSWKNLGKPLDDDRKSMMDRFVYFNDTTTDKTINLSKPVLAPPDVSEWLTQRVAEVLTLDAASYDAKTNISKRHFTPKGYGEYIHTLTMAQLPDVIKNKRYKLSAVVLEPPNIVNKGLRTEQGDKPETKHDVYIWELDVPVVLGYQGLNITDNKSYKVLLKTEIVRVPMQADGNLVSINGWKLEEYRPPVDIKAAPAADAYSNY